MRSVVIYTYFESETSNLNLHFFVNKELLENKKSNNIENIDYIIVINGYTYDESIVFPDMINVKVLKRKNEGFDYGGHSYALNYIAKKKKIYDYYFFMNSGVIGPIVPHYIKSHWKHIFINKINDKVKLVGTSIVCLPDRDAGGYGPKVEGFCFMVDYVGLDLLLHEKTIFCNNPDKSSTVINSEYGMSKCILKNGYSIDCMLPKYQNIDWTDEKNHNKNYNRHPSRQNSNYGYSINPYDVIFHKYYWHNEGCVNYNIIKQYIDESGVNLDGKFKFPNVRY